MMQIVPHYPVPILAGSQFGYPQSLSLGLPLFVQPIAMPLPTAEPTIASEPTFEETVSALRFSSMQLGGLQQTLETQNIRQRLENLLSRQQPASMVKESESLVERLVKELLLRCKQVHPVEVWSLLRNKGCQFLAPSQSVILQNLIFVLREHKVLPRKTLIEMIVAKCQKTGTDVSKTIVSRVVQLLYRSGCFYIHKDSGVIEEKDCCNGQGAKNTRMQLREEFFDYQMLRRTHDGLIVQWAHEEGLYLSADRWSMMLYQDKMHKAYMQTIIDQKTIPLIRWIDALYQHARSVPAVSKCIPVVQEYSTIPAVANSGSDKEVTLEMEVTWDHVSKSLRCVLSLVHAYLAVAKAPLPQPVPPATRPAAMFGEESLSKGRPVFGSRQSPMVSPSGVYDQEMPSSPPLPKQSSTNFSERASPSSLVAYAETNERDSDNDGQMLTSPCERPTDQLLQEEALLKALRGFVSAMSEPAQFQQKQKLEDSPSEWDAWKWTGPHDLLKSSQKVVNNEADMAVEEDDFTTEESLIGPMLSELIDEKTNNSASHLGYSGRTEAVNVGICKQKPYARMMSSTAVENLLCAPVAANGYAPLRGITSFMRVASLEDENYLHF